jgi:hypothetical protein
MDPTGGGLSQRPPFPFLDKSNSVAAVRRTYFKEPQEQATRWSDAREQAQGAQLKGRKRHFDNPASTR